MNFTPKFLSLIFLLIISCAANAQDTHEITVPLKLADTVHGKEQQHLRYKEADVIDVALGIVNERQLRKVDTTPKKQGKLYVAPLPGIGYSLNTGLAAVINANIAFYTSSKPDANISTVVTSVNYTQKNQFLFPVLLDLYVKDNKYNIQGNWLYAKFPQASYGLGGHTSLNSSFTMDYDNIRLITAVYKSIAPDLLIGPGYSFEYFWNVRELNPPGGDIVDMNKYGFSTTSISSAITLNLLYDTRRNSINPEAGNFANIIYRPNFNILGSDANWQSLVIDLRKYISIPSRSENILAFWTYEWLTFGADKAPYMLLPNTGGDPYDNTGRGYSPGRFRGKDMLYFEGEYRFGILRNGLLGGVVFCNLESFPEPNTTHFDVVYPGYGAGVRIKFNKYSRTNIAIDYAFGIDGTRGIFLNLGEVF